MTENARPFRFLLAYPKAVWTTICGTWNLLNIGWTLYGLRTSIIAPEAEAMWQDLQAGNPKPSRLSAWPSVAPVVWLLGFMFAPLTAIPLAWRISR